MICTLFKGASMLTTINNNLLNQLIVKPQPYDVRDKKIKGFYDTRHHFASRLVMSHVNLNTVRELLGHSDVKMTLRYAHLASAHKAEAASRLVQYKA
jgi:site-specific recombinase XerD